jgi:hypothetical protein
MSGLEHYDQEIFALDKRINRLAISCGVDLKQEGIIVSLIKGNYSVCTRGKNRRRKELRGLLMLKYDIQEDCIESLGAGKCSLIIDKVNEKLRKRGF